jgi:hypothetical protein
VAVRRGCRHPDRLLFRRIGCLAFERARRRVDHRGARRARRRDTLSHAHIDGVGCDGLRFPVRALADFLDHRRRGVPLQAHRENRPFEVIRSSVLSITADQRLQMVLVGFCFGAFL